MSSVIAGLRARREATKRAIKQAIEASQAIQVEDDFVSAEDAIWDLQRQLESLHAQIAAYERAEASTS